MSGIKQNLRMGKIALFGLLNILFVSGCGIQPHTNGKGAGPEALSGIPKPYCAFYGVARTHGTLTDQDIRTIAASFSVIEGELTREEMDAIRKYNPQLKFIHYMSPFDTGLRRHQGMQEFELKHRKDASVYLAARLAENINAGTTTFRLASVDSVISLRPSNIKGDVSEDGRLYVTWLQVEDEFMRIEAFDQKQNRVTVTRAFDHTTAVRHAKNSNVFGPVYTTASKEMPGRMGDGPDSKSYIRYNYRIDLEEVHKLIAEQLLSFMNEGYDGVKFDHMNLFFWAKGDAYGNPKTPWDFEHQCPYTATIWREALERHVNYIQNYILEKTGKYPVIFGNGHDKFFPEEGGSMYYMMKTDIKPYSIGTQWENFVSVPHMNRFGSPGGWRNVINLLNYCAKQGFEAAPLITFERSVVGKNDPVVLQHEKYGYTSYLMGYEPDGKTLVSEAVFRDGPNDTKVVEILPFCYYDLGVPEQSFDDAEQYQMGNTGVYSRKYTKGLVLVNPGDTDIMDVTLEQQYYDPDQQLAVTTIIMPAHTGKILLLKP